MEDLTPRVLVVAPYTPVADPDHGSAVALRGALRSMVDRTSVVIVHPDEPGRVIDPALADRAVAVATFPKRDDGFVPRRDLPALLRGRSLRSTSIDRSALSALVRRLVVEHRIDVVRAEAVEVGDVLPDVSPEVRTVLVVYEPARSIEPVRPPTPSVGNRLVSRLDTRATIRHEADLVGQADLVVALTEDDSRALASSEDHPPVTVIPLGWDVPATPIDSPVDSVVVFVGNFMHQPNVDAAIRLASSIFPLVTTTRPGTELRLVGPQPPPAVRRLETPDIVVTGRVDDVAHHLAAASVVVAPLHSGGGSRIKVLEALAAGAALVATPLALSGVDAPDDAVTVATSDDDFANAVVALLDDPARRRAQGLAAHRWARSNLSWDAVTERHLARYAAVLRR